MSLMSDLKVLYHIMLSPIRGKTHRDRLESFYSGQAGNYDSFRARLLQGRQELYNELPTPTGGVWVEMGGGTGSNLEYLGDRIRRIGKVYIVDLSPSLLEVARERIKKNNWHNVEAVEADATKWRPAEGHVDVVTFSYSLTMIPDWFAAADHAHSLLKEGGTLGVVDFYVSRKFSAEGQRQHGWMTRTFWQTWFAMDNVFPQADHLPYLQRKFAQKQLVESFAKVPYMPFTYTPFYRLIAEKTQKPAALDEPLEASVAQSQEEATEEPARIEARSSVE
jgi:S-adenosylmethionine-diacylgycerolhomoserine-N-methlytransferase